MSLRKAVLDTSFWSAAVHVGVDAYLPLFFDRPILVPNAVVWEIERAGEASNRRLREDQQRFRLWMEDGRLIMQDPNRSYPRFGAGEAACLGLTVERPDLILLVNEVKCYVEARRIGVRTVTVPEVVARLTRDGRMARRRAETMLDVLEETTASEIVARARHSLGGDEP